MSNPTLILNRFSIREKRATVKLSHTANVYSDGTMPTMADVLLDQITNLRDHNAKGYIGFTSYKRNHQKEDIEFITAVTLEYPHAKKAELIERLAEMPYAHYLIATNSDFDRNAEARILVAFPLETPITSPRLYTRVASLLWDEIGLSAQTKGSISSTFLWAVHTANPGVWFYDNDQFLDAEAYEASRQGIWVKAADDATPAAKPKPIADNGLWG